MNPAYLKTALSRLRHQKLRIFIWSVIFTPFILYQCVGFEIVKESPEQHRRTDWLDRAIEDMQKKGDFSFPVENGYRRDGGPYLTNKNKYGWMTYANECRNAKPKVPQGLCLQMVIEGATMDSAQQSVSQTKPAIQKLIGERPDLQLAGVYLVLTPAVRDKKYTGGITPYSVAEYFKTSESTIIKIGE